MTRPTILFGLFVLVFVLPAFVIAGWLLLVASQPVEVKLVVSGAFSLAGLWNLWRGGRGCVGIEANDGHN